MIKLDAIDHELIRLLRYNARTSISDIAIRLNLSRATVRSRLNRLENNGTILGYSAILPTDIDENAIRGIMLIEVDRHHADRVVKSLSGFPEVNAIHTTNGRFDLIVELNTKDLVEFDAILRRIRLINGVTISETHLLLATSRSSKFPI